MVDLPSQKHHAYHDCFYCRYHVRTSGTVPSVDQHKWISLYNLMYFLIALDIKAADENKSMIVYNLKI